MIFNKQEVNDVSLHRELEKLAERLSLDSLEQAMYFPKFFQVETIRLCNARCPFCPVEEWDKSVPLISDDLYAKIVDEMSTYADWIEMVTVQRAGEPLMDKKIGPRIRMMKDAGIRRVSIATNCSKLDEDKAVELIEAGLDEIMLSIDSVTKEEYELSRKGLKYETTMANIKRFFALRDRLKPEMTIRVRGVSFYDMESEKERAELAAWENFWGELKQSHDRIYMKRAHNWGNQKSWEGRTPDYQDVYHPCILPWSTMHITAMGIVALCPQDYDAKHNIGDINRQTIAEVWQGDNWQAIRQKHATGKRNDIAMCQGCRLFDPEFSLENWQQKQLYES